MWIRVDLSDPEQPSIDTAHTPPAVVGREELPLQLIGDEPLPLGLRRITLHQLDSAVAGLRSAAIEGGDHRAISIALERTRAVLRVVRTWIGEDVFRTEDAVLAYALDAFDEASTAASRLSHATAAGPAMLGEVVAAELTSTLADEHDLVLARTLANRQYTTDLVMTVSTSRSRFASWPVHPGLTDETRSRVPIPDAFSSIGGGLEESYRFGKRAFEEALDKPLPQQLVHWRGEARYLRHQVELIHLAWPEVLGGLIATLEMLDETLSTERALGDLAWRITTPPSPLVDEAAQHTMVLELERRRFRLRRRAFDIGRRIYLEDPELFLGRLSGYWMAWRRHRIEL